jgi:maltose O-acetyltransferase
MPIKLLIFIKYFYILLYKIFGFNFFLLQCHRVGRNIYRSRGVEIGVGSVIYGTTFSKSSGGDRFFIGKNCTITGAQFIGHDASPTLFIDELKISDNVELPGARCSYRAPIIIGNSVFIGVGAIILPGISIGNNVVVAAGSVVTKNVPNDVVIAGNPAKVIRPIEEFISSYREKMKNFPDRF